MRRGLGGPWSALVDADSRWEQWLGPGNTNAGRVGGIVPGIPPSQYPVYHPSRYPPAHHPGYMLGTGVMLPP